MTTEIHFDDNTRQQIKAGIDKLANTVKLTLGPGGQNVALKLHGRKPTITKDGVSVARVIELSDPVENVGAQLVKEVALKTVYTVGDGTTTATVLAQEIYSAGIKQVSAGHNPIEIKRGIDMAVKEAVKSIAGQSRPITSNETIKQIASISVNNDPEIGDIVAQALERVGKDGIVSMEESRGFDTYIKFTEGLQFGSGYMSPLLVTDQNKMVCVLDNPLILISERKVTTFQEVIKSLEIANQLSKPLLIIAEDFENEALATLIVNKTRGAISVCAVRAPSWGDNRKLVMGDIAILTGGESISEDNGKRLQDISSDWLGTCKKVIVTRDSTTIVDGHGQPNLIENHKNILRDQITNLPDDMQKAQAQERLAKLSGGIAVIHVGAATEPEMKEKKDRIEDAIHATKAAMEEGIIPGGGVAYLHAADSIQKLKVNKEHQAGVDIIIAALEAPINTIYQNATGNLNRSVVTAIREFTAINDDYAHGFNAKEHRYENLLEAGIIDPAKVARLALENAASIAGLLLTTRSVIVEKEPLPQLVQANPNFL